MDVQNTERGIANGLCLILSLWRWRGAFHDSSMDDITVDAIDLQIFISSAVEWKIENPSEENSIIECFL